MIIAGEVRNCIAALPFSLRNHLSQERNVLGQLTVALAATRKYSRTSQEEFRNLCSHDEPVPLESPSALVVRSRDLT